MRSRITVLKELHCLHGEIKEHFEGQCKLTEVEPDEGTDVLDVKFIVSILPDSGPYKYGQFDFLFKVTNRYPVMPPRIKCLTHVYHPNIDHFGEICLSLLDDWSSDYNCLLHCIHGLVFLMKHPNLEDPLSPYFCPEDADDMETFYKNVKISLEGGVIDGFIKFKRNIVKDEPNKKENKILDDCTH